MSPLIIDFSVSKIAHFLCAVLHISTIIVVLIFIPFMSIFIVFILLFSWLYVHYQYSSYNKNRITRIEIRPDLQAIMTIQKQVLPVQLIHNSFYGKYLMLLIWQDLDTKRIYRQAIFPDMCLSDSRRQLRVYCRIQSEKMK